VSEETNKERAERYAAAKIAEDEAVTDEMLRAAVNAVAQLVACGSPTPGVAYAVAYKAMRRAKREAMENLARSGWVRKVFKPLPADEAEALREYWP
jgi:hypothetical protein